MSRGAVLVTGVSGGIGRALVATFLDADFQVVASDHLDTVPEGFPGSAYVPADLAKFAEDKGYADSVVTAIRQHLGNTRLVGLINNAAIQILGGTDRLDRADWRLTLNVNLLAPFMLVQCFLPELEAARGCVINIGSIHARLTKRNFVAYATSKAALAGMTRALAVDLGPRVRVNGIEPAAIETEMLRAGFEGKPEEYAQLAACHPQSRLGQPEEVAKLALAMVGGGMEFLHGVCVGLDGGIGARLFDPD